MRKLFLIVLCLLMATVACAESQKFSVIGQGSKMVTNAGVPQQLSSTSVGTSVVYLSATSTNNIVTHDIIVYVGNSGVSAGGNSVYPTTSGVVKARQGIRIVSNDTVAILAADLSMLYVDSYTSNDGVTWTYLN